MKAKELVNLLVTLLQRLLFGKIIFVNLCVTRYLEMVFSKSQDKNIGP